MTEQNKKRWSRVLMALAGIGITLTILPATPLEWIKLVCGITIACIPAYWSNSDKLLGDKQ